MTHLFLWRIIVGWAEHTCHGGQDRTEQIHRHYHDSIPPGKLQKLTATITTATTTATTTSITTFAILLFLFVVIVLVFLLRKYDCTYLFFFHFRFLVYFYFCTFISPHLSNSLFFLLLLPSHSLSLSLSPPSDFSSWSTSSSSHWFTVISSF